MERGVLTAEVERFLQSAMRLRVDTAIGPPKPYKPLMLAAVVLLIGKGKIETADVFLDGALDSVCRQLLRRLYPSWPYRFDPRYPFGALENDGIWTLVPVEGEIENLNLARELGAKARKLLKHVLCARLDPAVFAQLSTSPAIRSLLLSELAERYLPEGARQTLTSFETDAAVPVGARSGSEALTERVLEEHLAREWSRS